MDVKEILALFVNQDTIAFTVIFLMCAIYWFILKPIIDKAVKYEKIVLDKLETTMTLEEFITHINTIVPKETYSLLLVKVGAIEEAMNRHNITTVTQNDIQHVIKEQLSTVIASLQLEIEKLTTTEQLDDLKNTLDIVHQFLENLSLALEDSGTVAKIDRPSSTMSQQELELALKSLIKQAPRGYKPSSRLTSLS